MAKNKIKKFINKFIRRNKKESSQESTLLSYEQRKALCKERKRIFYDDIKAAKKDITAYALKDDVELSDEQKNEINKFWDKYKFLINIDYRSHKTFYNRSGIFDPRYLTPAFIKYFVRPNLVPMTYSYPYQNKAYIPFVMSQARQPETIVRRVEGIYYNSLFQKISEDEAVEICLNVLESGREIVLKPSGLSGGQGIEFISKITREQLHEKFDAKVGLFIVQKAIHQHPEMAKLNDSTVNTVRLTSIIHNGRFIPLAALIKVGAPHARVDNYKHGGCLIGVNMDGTVQPWALDINRKRVTTLPSGVKIGEGGFNRVPCFESVLETAEKAHYGIPEIKLVSWDIAINDANQAEMIEANFGGDLKMHQSLTGPIFGDLTEEIIDTYILSKYSKPGVTKNFDYLEYYDHIEIEKYVGNKSEVVVPEVIAGKPVTCIGMGAFAYNKKLKHVKLPDSVEFIKTKAFCSCSNLTKIEQNGIKGFERNAFVRCPKLDKESWKKINNVRQKI